MQQTTQWADFNLISFFSSFIYLFIHEHWIHISTARYSYHLTINVRNTRIISVMIENHEDGILFTSKALNMELKHFWLPFQLNSRNFFVSLCVSLSKNIGSCLLNRAWIAGNATKKTQDFFSLSLSINCNSEWNFNVEKQLELDQQQNE